MAKVLVVGGRTTGLMMASDLARRGVSVRCIDASAGIDPHVRANLLHPRTLEIFQGLGLDEIVTRDSVPEKGFVFYRDRERIGESPHASIDSPFPFGLSQSQAYTESVLEAHLNGFGVEVERNVMLTSMEQDPEGVSVSLKQKDIGHETERFQWVIGCDGAHSSVRHLLGMAFPGDADDTPYILGDVKMTGDEDIEPQKGHVFFHDDGDLYLFTRLPGNRHFVVATLDTVADINRTPSLDELQDIVATRARSSLRLFDPHWLGYFRINYRLAPHYRMGRIFLAGDAAHVNSLLAGQGMNTGIQDAHNLAWKLALVTKGRAKNALLDSYEAERRGVAGDVIEMTRQITETMESYSGLSQLERNRFLLSLFASTPEQVEADRHAQEVDLDYDDSILTLSMKDGFQDGPKPGTRAPDATNTVVAGELTSLFNLPTDEQFRLFFFCGDASDAHATEIKAAADASGRFADWMTVYIICVEKPTVSFGEHRIILDRDGNMHRKYAATGPCIYLIRPDGYIAYRSSDPHSVAEYFEHLALILA